MTIRKLLRKLRKHDGNKIVRFIGFKGVEDLGKLSYNGYNDVVFFYSKKNVTITVGELILLLQMYSDGIETYLTNSGGYQGSHDDPIKRVEGGIAIILYSE